MTNFDEYRDVFVVADTIDDVVHPVTYELIDQARRIAKELGQLVQVMLLGENVQAEAEELVAHGADIVHVFESPLLKYYTTDGYTKVLTDFFEDHKPNILLIGATNNGRDLAPRMSEVLVPQGKFLNGYVFGVAQAVHEGLRGIGNAFGLVEADEHGYLPHHGYFSILISFQLLSAKSGSKLSPHHHVRHLVNKI